MATVVNTEPESNMIDVGSTESILVLLTDSSSTTEQNQDISRSGLIEISTIKHVRHQTEKLKQDFHLFSTSFEMNDANNIQLQQKIALVEFNDVHQCLKYIESCWNKHIILILSENNTSTQYDASKFKQYPQISAIYRRIKEAPVQTLLDHRYINTQYFSLDNVPESATITEIKDLDSVSQHILVQIVLHELIEKLPEDQNAKQDFLDFCRSKYQGNATQLAQIKNFDTTYKKENALKWYTGTGFVYRVVNATCAGTDLQDIYKIRFILRDLYVQLKKLHDEQLEELLEKDLMVYRGTYIANNELEHLKLKGKVFITRNFLSTTQNEVVARMFAGYGERDNDQVPVLFSLQINREEIERKPIALLHKLSHIPDEQEVMLSWGFVFRVDSCEQLKENSAYTTKINLVYGKDEAEIEEKLRRRLAPILRNGANLISFMAMFVECVNKEQKVDKFCDLLSNSDKSIDPVEQKQLPTRINNKDSSLMVSDSIRNKETKSMLMPLGESRFDALLSDMGIYDEHSRLQVDETVQPLADGSITTNSMSSFDEPTTPVQQTPFTIKKLFYAMMKFMAMGSHEQSTSGAPGLPGTSGNSMNLRPL